MTAGQSRTCPRPDRGLRPTYNTDMPPDAKRELYWMILLIALVGVVLIVTIILLMSAWRRHLERQKPRVAAEPSGSDAETDIWQAGGQRLVAEMSGSPKSDESDFDDGNDDPWNDPPDDDVYDDGYPKEDPP